LQRGTCGASFSFPRLFARRFIRINRLRQNCTTSRPDFRSHGSIPIISPILENALLWRKTRGFFVSELTHKVYQYKKGEKRKEKEREKDNSREESHFSVCVTNEHEDERKANHPLEADDDENFSLTSRRVFLLRT